MTTSLDKLATKILSLCDGKDGDDVLTVVVNLARFVLTEEDQIDPEVRNEFLINEMRIFFACPHIKAAASNDLQITPDHYSALTGDSSRNFVALQHVKTMVNATAPDSRSEEGSISEELS